METPDEKRGRVIAMNSVFSGTSNQSGGFESGASRALLGPVGSVLFGAIGNLLVAGLWQSPSWSQAGGCQRRPSSISRALAALLRTFHCACCALRSSIVIVSRRASRCSF